jgi:hypothetical protein
VSHNISAHFSVLLTLSICKNSEDETLANLNTQISSYRKHTASPLQNEELNSGMKIIGVSFSKKKRCSV